MERRQSADCADWRRFGARRGVRKACALAASLRNSGAASKGEIGMGSQQDAVFRHIEHVIEMHNDIRMKLFPRPDDRTHFINENTVVRLAAALEAGEVKAPSGKASGNESWGDICVRTLFLFRNTIVHECAGVYQPKQMGGSARHIPAYQAFCAKYPDANVGPGARLCLSASSVISPLLDGCLEYCRALSP